MPTFSQLEETTYPKAIVKQSHPPVTSTLPFTAKDGELTAGTLVSYDDNGTLIAYDGSASCVGVLLDDLETTTQTVGRVLVHGCVDSQLIQPNTTDALKALAQISIYA